MTPLEREMEQMGMLKKRPAVGGGAKPELNRKTVAETNDHLERERTRLAAQAIRGAGAYVAIVPPPVRKAVVWGGVGCTVAFIALLASVPWQRSLYVQEELKRQAESKADLLCTAGSARGKDTSSFWTWATGGSVMACSDWETSEGRAMREEAKKERFRKNREQAQREARGY
jgi:hypothetical protein